MSRLGEMQRECITSFPRVSGDEPYGQRLHVTALVFSPRERG